MVGDGPFDLVLVPPIGSHVELVWELPLRAGLDRALAEFSRLVVFDKRGTGLSDPVSTERRSMRTAGSRRSSGSRSRPQS